jgi:hypothetical protein
MARSAIHPGEHLAEELEELGMSAAELARRLKGPYESRHWHSERPSRDYRRHGSTPRTFFGNERRVLAESSEPVRAAAG